MLYIITCQEIVSKSFNERTAPLIHFQLTNYSVYKVVGNHNVEETSYFCEDILIYKYIAKILNLIRLMYKSLE